jgi:hypothetical protein
MTIFSRLTSITTSLLLLGAPLLAQDNITAGFHKIRQAAEQNWAMDGVVAAIAIGGVAWGLGSTGHRDVAQRLAVSSAVALGAGTIAQWLR